MFLLLCFLASCRKDKPTQEPLPILGTCQAVSESGCFSTTTANGLHTYTTSGGGEIIADLGSPGYQTIYIRHRMYPALNLTLVGYRSQGGRTFHMERLNSRHIKNRQYSRRTIVFPDGAKMTLVADSPDGPARSLSIYDGTQAHHYNLTCDVLEYSSTASADLARRMDETEADGEAGGIEITENGVLFFNLYTEDQPGKVINKRYNLGELHHNDPSKVTDHYDDPGQPNT